LSPAIVVDASPEEAPLLGTATAAAAPSSDAPSSDPADSLGQLTSAPTPPPTSPPTPPAVEAAACHDLALRLDGFVLDEPTLVNSAVLSYLAMVASFIECRPIGREELLHWLRRSMRQRSIGQSPRREYVLRYLHQHPP
jgi:hypothetical protein